MPFRSRNPGEGRDKKNVALPPGFGARLTALREERHLSKSELAEAAGVTYRTVHNLESERRGRAMERTLLSVSAALGIAYEALIPGPQAEPRTAAPAAAKSRPLRTPVLVLAALLVVCGASLAFVWRYAERRAEVVVADGRLYGRDAVFGRKLWEYGGDALPVRRAYTTWSDDVVLVGFGVTDGGGQLQALSRRNGEVIWQMGPDLAQMERALGAEIFAGAGMNFNRLVLADCDGDGLDEIAVAFHHGRNYPSALCLVGRDGALLRQYTNKGHIQGLMAADLDDDGRKEVVATGCNNDRAYNGPSLFLVDDVHWRGASVDSLCNPWSTEPDSCAVRVVFSAFPADLQLVLRSARFGAIDPRSFRDTEGRRILSCTVIGAGRVDVCRITLDTDLRPLALDLPDNLELVLQAAGADSLATRGPFDPQWRRAWLAAASRFGAAAGEP